MCDVFYYFYLAICFGLSAFGLYYLGRKINIVLCITGHILFSEEDKFSFVRKPNLVLCITEYVNIALCVWN